MALVKHKAAVECRATEPVENLLEARAPTLTARDERRVRQEKDALLKVLAEAPCALCAIECAAVINDWDVQAEVAQVSFCVVVQVGGCRHPHGTRTTADVIVQDDPCRPCVPVSLSGDKQTWQVADKCEESNQESSQAQAPPCTSSAIHL